MPYLRYDVVKLVLPKGVGHEQDGGRPALVVSNNAFNARSQLLTVIPFTSTQRALYVTEIEFSPPVGGLSARSILMTGQIITVSMDRIDRLLGRIEDPVAQRRIDSALATHLNLPGALP